MHFGPALVVPDHATARFHQPDTAVGGQKAIVEMVSDTCRDGIAKHSGDAFTVVRMDVFEGRCAGNTSVTEQGA